MIGKQVHYGLKKKKSIGALGSMNTINIQSTADVVDGLVCVDIGVLRSKSPHQLFSTEHLFHPVQA